MQTGSSQQRRHVMVTGAAGFLGSHLCDALLGEGHTVLGVDNLLTGNMRNLEHLKREPRFSFLQQDISKSFDSSSVDYIFNLASPASPMDYEEHGIETLQVGSIGVFNLLELARKHHATFFLASTSECYGDPLEHPQKESYWGHVNPVGPRSVYDESKRFAEAVTTAYRRYYKLDVRIVRIFNTYGPRLQMNDGRVISNFMKQALRDEDLTVYGDGTQTRSFCYVSDEIEGILKLAWSKEQEPTNIGNPGEFTILECAREVLAVTKSKSGIKHLPLPQDDPKQRRPDITKARTLLGWEPKIDLRTGLQLSVDYFRREVEAEQATAGQVAR
ncbi:MAG TPA: UDP-glucuronic acid decarboxylase family protein [Terriglobales bacterium]|nr:UDP-glucuronic acid decarboxylase family protein [Terriglobales bacterium]